MAVEGPTAAVDDTAAAAPGLEPQDSRGHDGPAQQGGQNAPDPDLLGLAQAYVRQGGSSSGGSSGSYSDDFSGSGVSGRGRGRANIMDASALQVRQAHQGKLCRAFVC